MIEPPARDAAHPDPAESKRSLRREVLARRRDLADKDRLSEQIVARLRGLPEYAAARTVVFYVDARSEVRTRSLLAEALRGGKRTVVPFCAGGNLELFWLHELAELEAAAFGILEPRAHLRSLAERQVDVREADLIVVPGVAFDRRGGRIGHGQGYYDRLLCRARNETLLAGLAFECQLVSEVPLAPHDILLDRVITERGVYAGPGRS